MFLVLFFGSQFLLHKKWTFPLRISLVNVAKSAENVLLLSFNQIAIAYEEGIFLKNNILWSYSKS